MKFPTVVMKKVKEIVFATNNSHKLEEIREIMGGEWRILSLKDIGCEEDIPETGHTLQENAFQKAEYVKEHYGYDCFADDTGLMVDALAGAPGIYSARYAGNAHNSEANMHLLLKNMEGKADRNAHFSTIICLIQGKEKNYFEGRVDGVITAERHGKEGFGYDPVFKPEGCELTFAEMSSDEKNKISHRGRATKKLIDYLKSSKI